MGNPLGLFEPSHGLPRSLQGSGASPDSGCSPQKASAESARSATSALFQPSVCGAGTGATNPARSTPAPSRDAPWDWQKQSVSPQTNANRQVEPKSIFGRNPEVFVAPSPPQSVASADERPSHTDPIRH